MSVSPAVAINIGASVAVGSLTAQAFNQYVVPKIASGQQAQAFETGFIGMAIPGLQPLLMLILSLVQCLQLLQCFNWQFLVLVVKWLVLMLVL